MEGLFLSVTHPHHGRDATHNNESKHAIGLVQVYQIYVLEKLTCP